jgi:hypothetical protein
MDGEISMSEKTEGRGGDGIWQLEADGTNSETQ